MASTDCKCTHCKHVLSPKSQVELKRRVKLKRRGRGCSPRAAARPSQSTAISTEFVARNLTSARSLPVGFFSTNNTLNLWSNRLSSNTCARACVLTPAWSHCHGRRCDQQQSLWRHRHHMPVPVSTRLHAHRRCNSRRSPGQQTEKGQDLQTIHSSGLHLHWLSDSPMCKNHMRLSSRVRTYMHHKAGPPLTGGVATRHHSTALPIPIPYHRGRYKHVRHPHTQHNDTPHNTHARQQQKQIVGEADATYSVRDVGIGMCTEWGVWAFLYHINRVELIATCLCVKRTVHLPA